VDACFWPSGVTATDGEGVGVVNAAFPSPGRGFSGGAMNCDHPMKITAERIRNKTSLFSIYKLIGTVPRAVLYPCPNV
jgi:hypothetical protein